MSHKKTNKPRRVAVEPTPFEQARDELFQHIMRCDVVGSHPDHQKEWFDETVAQEKVHVAMLPTADSRIARFATAVMPNGTAITIRGWARSLRLWAF